MEFFQTAFISLLLVSSAAYADTPQLQALQAALDARALSIADVAAPDVREVSQKTLNRVVAEGIGALRNNGDRGLANRYQREWKDSFSTSLINDRHEDLGDHAPLSKWLADFYLKLEDRLGSNMLHQGVLGDVYLMNFGLPLVFTPKGTWRATVASGREWVEYRKHFIPFANVVTYWSVLFACNKIVKDQGMGGQGKNLCKKASAKLRHVMGRYIAPKISDFVYNRSNGSTKPLEITDRDLVYLTAKDLESELLQDAQAEGDL